MGTLHQRSTDAYHPIRSHFRTESRPNRTRFVLLLQRYPEYYEITKEPIDIRTIAQRIQKNSYPTLDDLVADFTLMINNAKTFNEPGSKIYRVSERFCLWVQNLQGE